MKTLVISPQAGMCNRFRALCSAILMGELSDRVVRHDWTAEPAHEKDSDHVRSMRETTFSTFFEATDALPYQALDSHSSVDAVFSEWGADGRWYSRQSSAIRRCNRHHAVNVERRDAEYDSNPAKRAFLDFLCLSRATRIYGNAGSSFSEEAARFGGKPIAICRTQPQGLIHRVKSWIGLD